MSRCPKCGGHLGKVHRKTLERVIYASAYECPKCRYRFRRFHRWWFSTYRYLFSRYTVCLRCGTSRVHRITKRDHLDHVSKHPFSVIQQILGAPKNKCPYCRLQFHDMRPIAAPTALESESESPSAGEMKTRPNT